VSRFPSREEGRELEFGAGGGGKFDDELELRTADGGRGSWNWLVEGGLGDGGRYALVGVLLCEEFRLDSAGDRLELGFVLNDFFVCFGEYGGGGEESGASGSGTVRGHVLIATHESRLLGSLGQEHTNCLRPLDRP
jgi:hypothetical protein